MKTFRHRCPATNKDGRENCKATQEWPAGGRQAATCSTCGFAPGIPWQRQMAGKMGLLVEDEEPEAATVIPPNEPEDATPEAEESGEEEASPSNEAGTASGARSR